MEKDIGELVNFFENELHSENTKKMMFDAKMLIGVKKTEYLTLMSFISPTSNFLPVCIVTGHET